MAVLFAMEGAVSQGILWGLMTLGVYLTFRILNVADMTVDGSFTAGAAIVAIFITKYSLNPLLILFLAFLMGTLCGLVTGLMNTKLKINILLSSILTQIALYSINIRIMGRPNISFNRTRTIVTMVSDIFKNSLKTTHISLIIGTVVIVIIVALLYWFFGTEVGSAIRATGSNEHMVRAMGVNTDTMKILGLMISNGMVAMSGALVSQCQGFADVGMGTGAIVIGLASIIIGEVIFGAHFGFWWVLLSAVFGSIIYRIIIAVVLQMGLRSTDLKLLTALVVAASLSVPEIKHYIARRRRAMPGRKLDSEENTRHLPVKTHADSDTTLINAKNGVK